MCHQGALSPRALCNRMRKQGCQESAAVARHVDAVYQYLLDGRVRGDPKSVFRAAEEQRAGALTVVVSGPPAEM
jgi:hypothetical protein